MKGIHTGVAIAALLIGASAWSADTKIGTVLDDGAVTAKVKAALVGNPDTKARQINVDTSNGVVTLSGTVDSPLAKMSAESTARNVSGVNAVENHLMVGGSSSADAATASTSGAVTHGTPTPSDRTVIASAAPGSGSTAVAGDIDSQVMQALKSDHRTESLHIDVATGKSGTVTLSGTVPSTTDRSAAADVARSVSGVGKVDNKIMVKKGSAF